MKHIKSYQGINESSEPEVIQELKDICLELEDMGLEIFVKKEDIAGLERSFTKLFGISGDIIFIVVGSMGSLGLDDSKLDHNDEIREVIDRTRDYMKSEGYKSAVMFRVDIPGSPWGAGWVADSEFVDSYSSAIVAFQK